MQLVRKKVGCIQQARRKGGWRVMLSTKQKQLILAILTKERGRLFSKYKGKLLDQTIADLSQMLRNEQVNSSGRGFSNVVSLEDRKKR